MALCQTEFRHGPAVGIDPRRPQQAFQFTSNGAKEVKRCRKPLPASSRLNCFSMTVGIIIIIIIHCKLLEMVANLSDNVRQYTAGNAECTYF